MGTEILLRLLSCQLLNRPLVFLYDKLLMELPLSARSGNLR